MGPESSIALKTLVTNLHPYPTSWLSRSCSRSTLSLSGLKSFLVIVKLFRFKKQADFARCIEAGELGKRFLTSYHATKCLTYTQGALLALASVGARHRRLTGPLPWVRTCDETNLRLLDRYLLIDRRNICPTVNQGDSLQPSREAPFGSKLPVACLIISETQNSHEKARTGQLSASTGLCHRDSANRMGLSVDESSP